MNRNHSTMNQPLWLAIAKIPYFYISKGYKRIWDALTGRYFMLPTLFGLSQTFNIQNDEK